MNFQTFYHIKHLIAEADRLVSNYDTVTFDLFDTLFIRRIHNPDMLKPAVARFITKLAFQHGETTWTWESIQTLRDQLETVQRQETAQNYVDHEARYPDFMKQVLQKIFKDKMTDNLLQRVTDYEMSVESAMIVPREELVKWMIKLHGQNKTILIISDIYLPSTHLKKLLDRAGLTPYVKDVISSADTFYAKASGKAFPLIQDKYNLDVERWMHIGDNPISDGVRPFEYGICTFVLKDISEKYRKSVAQMYTVFANRRLFWKGRQLQHLMLPLESENSPQDPLYIEGYNFLAPLVGAFILEIAEKVQRLGIKKIFFLSREGWTFKKFWEKAIPWMYPEGVLPDVSYLYVSRFALTGASCAYTGLTQSKADIAFLPANNKDFRDLCRVFNLDIRPLEPVMKRYGLGPDEALSPLYPDWSVNSKYKFQYLLEDTDFQKEIKKQTTPYNQALLCYLEHEGFFDHDHVALIDVGWSGTIQRLLFDAIQHQNPKPRMHGFLFAASRGIPYPTTPDNQIEGIIYDKDRFDFAGSTILNVRDFFEEAFRAPHPGLRGYQLKDNDYDLIFQNQISPGYQEETIQNEHFSSLQKGILDGAAPFGAASSILGFGLEELKPWLRFLLVSKLAFPKTKEVTRIRHKHHFDEFSGQHKPPKKFFKRQKRLWDYSSAALRFLPWIRMQQYVSKSRIE